MLPTAYSTPDPGAFIHMGSVFVIAVIAITVIAASILLRK